MSELGSAPTPSAILEARGAFLKHPERLRQFEPNTGRGVGPPPDWLHEHEKALWNETVAMCAPGVFQSSDGHALLIYVMVLADVMPGKRKTPGRPPKARFANLKAEMLLKFWAKFGMTPSDRMRIQVEPMKESGRPKTGLAKFMAPRT